MAKATPRSRSTARRSFSFRPSRPRRSVPASSVPSAAHSWASADGRSRGRSARRPSNAPSRRGTCQRRAGPATCSAPTWSHSARSMPDWASCVLRTGWPARSQASCSSSPVSTSASTSSPRIASTKPSRSRPGPARLRGMADSSGAMGWTSRHWPATSSFGSGGGTRPTGPRRRALPSTSVAKGRRTSPRSGHACSLGEERWLRHSGGSPRWTAARWIRTRRSSSRRWRRKRHCSIGGPGRRPPRWTTCWRASRSSATSCGGCRWWESACAPSRSWRIRPGRPATTRDWPTPWPEPPCCASGSTRSPTGQRRPVRRHGSPRRTPRRPASTD